MSDTNIIYYNVNLINNTLSPIPASVLNRNQNPIIDKPDDWEMSVVRFGISSELIPLFMPTIPNPLAPLTTNMSVTLSYLGTPFQSFVNIDPHESKQGIFDYGIYLDHVNDAFTTSFNALKAAFPAAPGAYPPLLFLNPVTSLISMYTQDFYLESNAPNYIQIAVNQPLQQILDLPATQSFDNPAPNGIDFLLAVRDYAPLIPATGTRYGYPNALNSLAGNWIQSSQEFRSMEQWNFVKGIIFTTGLIPIANELLPTVSTQEQNTSVARTTLSILTDFDLPKDVASPTRNTYEYVPTAEYRMISLKGVNGFSAIDVQANYQTYDGKIFPIFLASDTNMSLKLMFRRKTKL